jgi:hypothetical protein
MMTPRTAARIRTALLVLVIAVLALVYHREHRRSVRLGEALALFQSQAEGRIHDSLTAPRPLGSAIRLLLKWNSETVLEEVIRSFEKFTTQPNFGGLDGGLPIEVDADGLREAGQSLGARLVLPPAPTQDVSLQELLREILKPMGLDFHVKDGKIEVTSSQLVARRQAIEGAAE